MNMDKARAILAAASGMKRYEWNAVVRLVNRTYEEASSRVELTQEDAEGIERMLRRENEDMITP